MTPSGSTGSMDSSTPLEAHVDWIVVGSGFGGSVAALRLAEKGYTVAVIERGRRYEDTQLPTSTSDPAYTWAPRKDQYGIMRSMLFRHVVTASQTGVGGGSLMYGGVLFRPQQAFYTDTQWGGLARWEQQLEPHFAQAEYMLGVQKPPWTSSVPIALTRRLGEHFGVADTFALAPTGVFFGEPGRTVADPYFGGDGPDRTGCIRCGECMVGCRTGAANRLTKNYLWFAEKRGVRIIAEQEVVDVVPRGDSGGGDGYIVTTERRAPGRRGERTRYTASGVVFAGGAVGTNELLASCKLRGSLPRISDRLGDLVRTNSEAILGVVFPDDIGSWQDVTASSRIVLDGDTQIEFLTVGRHADTQQALFTVAIAGGAVPVRVLKWLRAIVRRPRDLALSLRRRGWSTRSLQMLVMQPRDNAIRFRPKRGRGGRVRLVTEIDTARPAPTYQERGYELAQEAARITGGTALSNIFEGLGNIRQTAHMLGGAVVGADADRGVIDTRLRVFGYRDLIVCDAAALPANPGVNPALTITALAEYAMAQVPAHAPPAD